MRMKLSGMVLMMSTLIIIMLCMYIVYDNTVSVSLLKQRNINANIEINSLIGEVNDLRDTISTMNDTISALENLNKELLKDEDVPASAPEVTDLSRNYSRPINMRVTAYDLSVESCGKLPSHPEYGITASGKKVQEWHTVASGPSLLFGTKIYIPYFKDNPNKGIFTVEDRGGAIKDGCIDVFIADNQSCLEFGVQFLDVYIINEGGE